MGFILNWIELIGIIIERVVRIENQIRFGINEYQYCNFSAIFE